MHTGLNEPFADTWKLAASLDSLRRGGCLVLVPSTAFNQETLQLALSTSFSDEGFPGTFEQRLMQTTLLLPLFYQDKKNTTRLWDPHSLPVCGTLELIRSVEDGFQKFDSEQQELSVIKVFIADASSNDVEDRIAMFTQCAMHCIEHGIRTVLIPDFISDDSMQVRPIFFLSSISIE